MIDYSFIESNLGEYKNVFKSGVVEHVVIDNFLDGECASRLLAEFPDPEKVGIGKSRDYIFAKNKFEKSNLDEVGEYMTLLKRELVGDRFRDFLRAVTGEEVFVDPEFHGGGMHQGGEGSYLNMHADFNYHPVNKSWFRNLNILIYFNKGWEPEYGGQLKLRNKNTGAEAEVEPLFNRCVIMFTRDYTLHGYDRISFPVGSYRRSIAAYAYSEAGVVPSDIRSTTWYPDDGGVIKKVLGKNWPKLVAMKTKFLGSSTAKNR